MRAPVTPAEWEACFALRWRILRAPWGQPRGSETDALEASSVHRMVCDEHGRVLAVGRLQRDSDGAGQIRYMAVETAYQRHGLGTILLEALEAEARAQGMTVLRLHARENALAFYRRRGYRLIEPSHVLFNSIQHYRMEKRWQTSSA